ncbi:hypothetical protein Fleli_1602 [Bernardetia litoralis DSM 6794]|uniref:DUF4421 domain-containing protein n=1 Tax=Bernardetia litoralis (strain ATCC 23117 / DSM 6794 / NBRC 15988 / NCIMB 1366 / Fx l1 / Sio-4) TaxID=880071 RepID=I4AJ85_BERLS|nr:hypothetical protein [Bernardetia litoralis]AFM04020.1 hypothetical protein Fleli_1602 [Bernardetia litoralis DSM 6794]
MKIKFTLFFAIFLISFSVFSLVSAQDTSNNLKGKLENKMKNITGKKWGLAHYIEIYVDESDTLFSMRDCEKEFLELNEDKSYNFSAFDRTEKGTWQTENDSTFVLKKLNGKVLRRYEIYGISSTGNFDSMAILDITQRNTYLEVYAECKPNDVSQFYDSRSLFQETVGWGIVGGIQYYHSPVLEFGIAKAKWNWKKTFFAVSLSGEIAPFNNSFKEEYEIRYNDVGGVIDSVQTSPWNNYYGLALTGWTQSWVALGGAATIHTDGEKINPGLRILMGVSPRTLFGSGNAGKIGNGLHLTYSYNFIFAKAGLDKIINNLNRHAFSLRFVIPVKTREVETRKILNYEN